MHSCSQLHMRRHHLARTTILRRSQLLKSLCQLNALYATRSAQGWTVCAVLWDNEQRQPVSLALNLTINLNVVLHMKVLYFQKFNNTQPGQTENLYIKTGRRLERAQCIGVESDQAVEFMPMQTCPCSNHYREW